MAANGRRIRRVLDFAALAYLALAGLVIVLHLNGSKPIAVLESATAEEADIVVMRASWKDADNVTHAVETTRQEGESLSDFTARHKAAVEALKAEYPPG